MGPNTTRYLDLGMCTPQIQGSCNHTLSIILIVATDQNGHGLRSEATLNIQVQDSNDNYPQFTSDVYEFTVTAADKPGDTIGQVVAKDNDSTEPNNRVLYLSESDPLGKFKINVQTGGVELLEGFYSAPRKSLYTLTVSAMDLGYPSRRAVTKVVVRAPDLQYNDFPPQFHGKYVYIIDEELPVGSVVGKLNVTDKDQNSRLRYKIDPRDSVPFAIKRDGAIVNTERIDRDSGNSFYTFTVKARDGGEPPLHATRDVSILIRDINDNAPRFTMDTYSHTVAANFPSHTVVATPFAYDDIDQFKSIYHYSMSGENLGYFHIDPRRGIVMTTDAVRTLPPQILTYTLHAVDQHNTALKATAKLNVQVMEPDETVTIIETDGATNFTCIPCACCLVPCADDEEVVEVELPLP